MAVLIGLIGAAHDRKTVNKEFNLGTPCLDDQNRTWVYVKFNGTVAASATAVVDGSFGATSGAGSYTNGATAAAANDYGWVRKTTSPL